MSIFRKKVSKEELEARFHEDFDKYVEGAVNSGNMRLVFQNSLAAVYSIVNAFYMAFLKNEVRSKEGRVVGIIVTPEDFKGLTTGDGKFFMYIMNRNTRSNIPSYQVDENFAGQLIQIAKKARTNGQKVDLTLEAKTLSKLGLKWYSNEEEGEGFWENME